MTVPTHEQIDLMRRRLIERGAADGTMLPIVELALRALDVDARLAADAPPPAIAAAPIEYRLRVAESANAELRKMLLAVDKDRDTADATNRNLRAELDDLRARPLRDHEKASVFALSVYEDALATGRIDREPALVAGEMAATLNRAEATSTERRDALREEVERLRAELTDLREATRRA